MRLIRPIEWSKPPSRVFGRSAGPTTQRPLPAPNQHCLACLEHASNDGVCLGAAGDCGPSRRRPPCWTEFQTTRASTDPVDGCMDDSTAAAIGSRP
ncbi:MAG: hypothetical protein BWX88_05349 [Planctomycetes bacterium ADurb.Bin126]|nr:MAG: hypothetical protein BWX88_05349 [Planctomycetes bacterium ADurb.Bin126]HOD84726.1 hypothetical protein [Phycisphaerae bacterium]